MDVNEEVIKHWLTKLGEWHELDTSKWILEMRERVPELTDLLSELEKVLINLEPRQILCQYPSVPKLLHILIDNLLVQTTESLHHLVMRCVTAVAVSSETPTQQQDGITNKSVKWVKSLIKKVCDSTHPMVKSLAGIAEDVGCMQPVELTEELNNQLVMSLVEDLSDVSSRQWNDSCGGFIPRCPIQGITLRNISEMCLPIMSKSVARPLVEALLCCDVAGDVMSKSHSDSASIIQVEDGLSPYFLSALEETSKDWYLGVSKDVPLSYDARLGLWTRHCTYFEDEILGLLEIFCTERIFMSRYEMRKIVNLRDLPKALSENISLFCMAFGILQRIILETEGDLHVMKFTGTLLERINECQRQNKPVNPFCHISYANVWSTQLLSDFVNTLNISWTDMPPNAFLHHTKTIENCINEICQARTESRCESYYVWLILQGFPELLQKCSWTIVVEAEQFVDSSLAIELWHHGGATEFDNNVKSQIRNFVHTLRLLKNKCQVITSDILCAINSINDVVHSQKNVGSLIRNLVMIFLFTSSSSQNLNLQDIFSKLVEELPKHYALDYLLDWFEETLGIQDKLMIGRWPYEEHYFKRKTENYLKLLQSMYAKSNELIKHLAQDTVPEKTQINTGDLRARFETVCKILRQQNKT